VENVCGFTRRMPKSTQSYLDVFIEATAALGFAVRAMRHNASVWSEWPRDRIWIIGVSDELGGPQGADLIAATVEEIFTYRRINPPTPVVGTILSVDTASQARRRAAQAEHQKAEAQCLQHNTSAVYQDWRKSSANVRSTIGVSADFRGWSSRPDISLIGIPKTPRVLDLLDIGWAIQLAKFGPPGSVTSTQARRGLWANVTQTVQRKPFGPPGCLATHSLWYSYEHDFTIDGQDALRLQGFPLGSAPKSSFTNAQLFDLAGEGFHAASVGSFLYAFLLNPYGPWWERSHCQKGCSGCPGSGSVLREPSAP